MPGRRHRGGGGQRQLAEPGRRGAGAEGPGRPTVLMVTDPFHEDRSMAIASDLGLTPSPTPDPDLADHGLVDGALLLEGGARRGPRAGSSGSSTSTGYGDA